MFLPSWETGRQFHCPAGVPIPNLLSKRENRPPRGTSSLTVKPFASLVSTAMLRRAPDPIRESDTYIDDPLICLYPNRAAWSRFTTAPAPAQRTTEAALNSLKWNELSPFPSIRVVTDVRGGPYSPG